MSTDHAKARVNETEIVLIRVLQIHAKANCSSPAPLLSLLWPRHVLTFEYILDTCSALLFGYVNLSRIIQDATETRSDGWL